MHRSVLRASQLVRRFAFNSVRYTVSLDKSGPCCGKGNAAPTNRSRCALTITSKGTVKRWRVCQPLL
jgi:hypothetical protein